MKASQSLVRAARKTIVTNREGIEGWNSAQSDLHEDKHSWTKPTSQTCQGCGNLVPASPHTASGETSVHALWADAKRVSSVEICLVK